MNQRTVSTSHSGKSIYRAWSKLLHVHYNFTSFRFYQTSTCNDLQRPSKVTPCFFSYTCLFLFSEPKNCLTLFWKEHLWGIVTKYQTLKEHHLKHLLLYENWCLHTFTRKGKSDQKLALGIISFPVAPLRYLLKRIPPTRYTTSKEIKLQRKDFKNV